jgi:hypothetical protein
MSRKTLLVAVIACVFANGCATHAYRKTTAWPWHERAPCAKDQCSPLEAMAASNDANEFCRSVHNYYERGAFGASSSRLFLAGLGAVAGSVVPPLAKGSAKDAWAGLSGSTNALQTSLDQAFSTAMAVKSRAKVAEVADTAAGKVASETTDNARVMASIDMARQCSMASARAQQEALKAMSQ